MLSPIARSCFVAALLCTSALAQAIAFGNAAFAGISFGSPFSVNWFGGDGTVRLPGRRFLPFIPQLCFNVDTNSLKARHDKAPHW